MQASGMSERHALRLLQMSASSLRYAAVLDRNPILRQEIEALKPDWLPDVRNAGRNGIEPPQLRIEWAERLNNGFVSDFHSVT